MKNILLCIFATVILSSCEKEVKVDIEPIPPTLSINSATKTNDTISVSIGKTVSTMQYKNNMDMNISNAVVTLYTNGSSTETLYYDAIEGQYTSNTIAKAGNEYKITVSAPGYKIVEATTPVPSHVKIDEIKKFANARVSPEGMDQDEVRVSFTDPATSGDYYIVKYKIPMLLDTYANFTFELCVNSTDASVETITSDNIDQNSCLSSEGIFLRDALFNGAKKELRLFIDSHYTVGVDDNGTMLYPEIELYHVTEAYYRFLKSYQYALYNNGNPFSEPTNVYSNVKDGYGIFSIQSVDIKEVK